MNVMTIAVFLTIGAATGWQFGKKMDGGGFGHWGNIALGALGGIVGGYLFKLLIFAVGSFIGSMVTAGAGAIALLYLVELYEKRDRSTPH